MVFVLVVIIGKFSVDLDSCGHLAIMSAWLAGIGGYCVPNLHLT